MALHSSPSPPNRRKRTIRLVCTVGSCQLLILAVHAHLLPQRWWILSNFARYQQRQRNLQWQMVHRWSVCPRYPISLGVWESILLLMRCIYCQSAMILSWARIGWSYTVQCGWIGPTNSCVSHAGRRIQLQGVVEDTKSCKQITTKELHQLLHAGAISQCSDSARWFSCCFGHFSVT